MKTILDALGIEIVEVLNEKVIATMPVNDATRHTLDSFMEELPWF